MNDPKTGRPDIAGGVPAPLLFLGAIAADLLLQWLLPWPSWSGSRRWAAGGACVALGCVPGFWALATMRRRRTTVMPIRPSAALVTEGPFRLSRHPMYLSMLLYLAGASLLLGTSWGLATVPLAALAIHRACIVPEERYLERRFGEEYRSYRARVRPWL